MSFSMSVPSNTTHGARRQRRMGWVGRDRQTGEIRERTVPSTGSHLAESEAAPRSRRLGGACQDHALYSCSCGYAFDAPVSTSVDCPHCGDRQAW